MTADQVAITGLLVLLLAVFALDRFRIEVVALIGLACGVLLGIVPFESAFSGLSSPAVITVIEILLIVQALDRSRLLEVLGSRLHERLGSPRRIVVALCVIGASLSTVMNNIGAFALMLPVVFSLTRSAAISPRLVLMPLSFATLLGGLCTIVGTPANLIVSESLRDAQGSGFGFLDFAPTGIAVALAGLAAILIWTPRTLGVPPGSADQDPGSRRIVTEATVHGTSIKVGELSAQIDGSVHVVQREGRRLFPLRGESALQSGDLILLDAEEAALRKALASDTLVVARSAGFGSEMEAVVMPRSTLVGSRAATIEAFSEPGLRLVAVTTHNPRVEGGLDELQLGIGDILHLEGEETALREFVDNCGLMAVTPMVRRENRSFSPTPVLVFALGILVAAFGIAPPEIAFGAVAVALAAGGALDLRAALADLNWPIVLLLVAMLPLGEAVATTGAASTIAATLTAALPGSSPIAAAALMLGVAMLITPFVNNATTAVILAPIAVELAQADGVSPALLLMAVAIGASSDFLTPFGHHNNTLAYGLGGYRFRDFPRLGWPVSLAAFLVGVVSCVLVWA